MKPKRFLIAPLDWGLGHATRCIPIIRQLLQFKCEVIIAGNGQSLILLRMEFPQLDFVELPAYDPQYSGGNSIFGKMLLQIPKFSKAIKQEYKVIEKIVADKNIDVIISDNRFGCRSDKIKSIFITHQVNILMPQGWGWLSRFVNLINHHYIKKFTACWIPDNEDDNLTGIMTANAKLKVEFIGALSRFTYDINKNEEIKRDILVILSGPEPQRTLLEKLLITQISSTTLTTLIVRGIPSGSNKKTKSNIEFVNHLNAAELEKAIRQSDLVIARSGYSTVMDLAVLRKQVLFIPTPGQTEQEYLAAQLKVKRIAYFATQNQLNLLADIEKAKNFDGFVNKDHRNEKMKNILEELLQA